MSLHIYKSVRSKFNVSSLWIILAAILIAAAQNNQIKFEQLSIEDGLSQSTVIGIIQDRNGFIWFGTSGGGLNRFDPAKEMFVHYRYDPQAENSLNSDNIQCIAEDKNGWLWIGTNGGGMDVFDTATGKFTHFEYNEQVKNSISSNYINCIFEDSRRQRGWDGNNSKKGRRPGW